jgi:hypothetical protein
MDEYFFTCPYCLQSVSILIDTSERKQEYIEDCEVCCNPIEFNIVCIDGEIIHFDAHEIGQ